LFPGCSFTREWSTADIYRSDLCNDCCKAELTGENVGRAVLGLIAVLLSDSARLLRGQVLESLVFLGQHVIRLSMHLLYELGKMRYRHRSFAVTIEQFINSINPGY
jgi:hypothetical protein